MTTQNEKIAIGSYNDKDVYYNAENGEVFYISNHGVLATARNILGSMPKGLSKEEAEKDFSGWKAQKA